MKKSLKINFVMNTILTMTSFIFPLISFPYVSRILLPEGTGKVSFATSLISYFTMFAQLGIPTYGVVICARVRENREELTRTVHELLFINLIMSAISYFALAIALIFIPRLQNDRKLYIIASLSIVLTSIGMEWLYKALEQYTYITIRSIIFKIIALISMFILIHNQDDYIVYGGISILASSASNIFNLINAHNYIDLKPVKNYNIKHHLRPVAVFFAMTCATTIYTNLDSVMLGFLTTDKEVGYYNAAIKIKCILVSIITSLGHVLLPRLTYYIQNNMMSEFQKITDKAIDFIIVISCPMALYFILFAKEGILFLSGRDYVGSILPMQILMPTLLMIGLTSMMGLQILVPLGNEILVLYSVIAGAIVDFVLNILLIPHFGAAGAATGTLVAESVVLIIQFNYLKKLIYSSYTRIKYWAILLGLFIGALPALLVKSLKYSNFNTLVISAIFFFGGYTTVVYLAQEPIVIEIKQIILSKFKICDRSNSI